MAKSGLSLKFSPPELQPISSPLSSIQPSILYIINKSKVKINNYSPHQIPGVSPHLQQQTGACS